MKSDRACVICKQRFTPSRKLQRACGTPCSRKLAGLFQRGQQPKPFAAEVAKRRVAKRLEIETLCHRRWPELSVREIEIFNFAVRVGYNRGYARGYNEMKRRYTKTAA